ncbi:MAG: AsmA family protein [Lentisphaeria bacterium]
MKKKWKKKILIAVAITAGIILLAAVLLVLNLNTITEIAVKRVGSKTLGVPVRLDEADVSLRGFIRLDGLQVGSPAGYDAPQMFKVAHIEAEFDIMSLLSDEIIVQNVTVDGPEMIVELSAGKTNWAVLLEQLETRAETEKDASEKKMLIDRLLVKNGSFTLIGIPMVGPTTLPLPQVELLDIGKDEEGKSMHETMLIVIGNVYNAALKVAGNVLPSEQVKQLTVDISGAIGEAAVNISGTGVDAARDATDTIGDTIGGAAEKGKDAIQGLFGGDKEEEKETEAD